MNRKSPLAALWLFPILLLPLPTPATTFLVDQAAPNAADSNPGTENAPFKTVQRAAGTARAGDTVLVMAGAYPELVKISVSGAEGEPITFKSMPAKAARVHGFTLDASYIIVQGFEITAPKPAVAVQLGGTYCQVLDNFIHHMSVAVAGTVGKPDHSGAGRDYSAVAHNRIAFNKVYLCQYGFMLGGNDWLVENNEVDRLFMYSPGNKFNDCDYSRFFGQGCVERFNYFHGSIASEIRVAHVDCLQTFTANGEHALDLRFENNTCFDFHQMCMVESAPHIGSVSNWSFRGNIVSANSTNISGGWGPDIIQTLNVTIANNTISGVRWATIGLRGKESTGGNIYNNILANAERAVIHGDQDFSPANPLIEYNLTFNTSPAEGDHNLNARDPLFVDAPNRNFRLRPGSPAIAAGKSALTIGALDYPNVYYVDPRHPAANDHLDWGYPAVPFVTIAKACSVARPGDTILLRAGVYREPLSIPHGVTVKPMDGENVTLSAYDKIEGWSRQTDGSWSAPLASPPTKIRCDARPWNDFSYNTTQKCIVLRTADPRAHLFETLARSAPNPKPNGLHLDAN